MEYRNDHFGLFQVTGSRCDFRAHQTGHPDTDHPVDWTLNGAAAAEYRTHGATIGHCQPVTAPPDGMGEDVLELVTGHRGPIGPSARFAIVDSALGLVESLDVLSNEGHRALGLGSAVSAGDLALGDLREFLGEAYVLRHRPRCGGAHRGLEHPVTKS